MLNKTFTIGFALATMLCLPAVHASASLLVPDSIVGIGLYNKSEQQLIDGVFTNETGVWTGPTTVHWSDQTGPTGVVFTLDYGSLKTIDDMHVSVDNNDSYRVEYSQDNVNYTTLFEIAIGDGEIGGGMDTMRSVFGDPEYVANMDFSSVQARYLRMYATGGDRSYAISEIQAYGSNAFGAVPEPATIAIWSVLGICGLAFGSRLRK